MRDEALRKRQGIIMRIACVCSSNGSHYRFYRTSKNLKPDLAQLIPLLLEPRFNARIGGMDDDPDVVLTVGPLDADLADEFRRHVMAHLGIEPLCVPRPQDPQAAMP